ncbi:MAG: chromate efflux transporter, partial [Cyanobacteria bacterium P01_F01_bin.42]
MNPQPQSSQPTTPSLPPDDSPSLGEIAAVFFRLGTVAFGGPAAHIAMMDDEVVKRRQWMNREALLDLISVTNLLPGPNSTELAIHIGYEQRGWPGLFVAGSSFILPAMTLVWSLAVVYERYQTVPQVGWLLYGIKPVIIAVVLQALWKLSKKAIKDRLTGLVGATAIAAYFLGVNEIALLLAAGLTVMLLRNGLRRSTPTLFFSLPLLAQTSAASAGSTGVFLFFLKVGSVLYGSGYVLLAFLQRDLVEQHQWLTSQQLLDAVAIGQVTPGPVFTTATFVGYLLAGHAGAIAGTIGIFLPAFLLVGLVNPWVPKLRQSPWSSAFLDGVNAGSLGLMAGVTFTLGQAALVDGFTTGTAILSAIAILQFKV